ncbi:NPC intracellular cholesterol transporter 2-like [Actinia tenebrosa]|uniref:NPC intracellular cholesterol transporter 2-like n=1 Tax=Actinia tenebrosa TaxID=6105 RepID=A0A6P8IUF0_ACTTE|nr:NPC intracellular cholesterol transporter 2-like [Actinia tenebrosa]
MSTLSSFIILWILAAGVCHCESRSINFTDCGSQEGKVNKFDITPCGSDPCVIKRGVDETANLTFVVSEYITSLHLKAWVIIKGMNIPIPLPTDACKGYGLTCPIKAKQTANFIIKDHVPNDFLTGNLSLKVEFIDPEKKIVVCFEFPVVVE